MKVSTKGVVAELPSVLVLTYTIKQIREVVNATISKGAVMKKKEETICML